MRTLVLCTAVAALLLPRAGSAQSVTLTEAAALERLSADSPHVRAIQSAINAARANVAAAGRWPNPRFTVARESAGGTTEYLTTVGQALPISGQRSFQIRAANALADAASARADDALRRARADLRLAFADLVAAQVRERELTAARDRFRELADILGRREAAGDAAGFDRLRADREVADADADRSLAAIERARAQAALAAFFSDVPDPSRLVATEAAVGRSELPALDLLIQRAESTRGELAALQKDLESSQWSLRAADRRKVPELELVAGTKSTSALGGDVGGVISLQLTLPVFDSGRAERAAAESRARQAQARADALRLSLHAQIAGLHAAVLERRSAADRYRTAATNGAEQIERIARVSYDAGERGILELLDAYRTGAAARIRQAALDAAIRQAEIELEFASGWELK